MDSRLIIYSLIQITFVLSIFAPINFLTDAMVKEHGIPCIEAGHIIAFYGISNVVGSILSGVCANFLKNNGILFIPICMIGFGICCVGMAFSSLYWHFVVCCFMHGTFLKTYTVIIPISLTEMFGVESLHVSYGAIMACSGIANLFGSPMIGWFKELQGSYDLSFNVAGGFHFLGGILAFILLWLHKRK